MLNQRDVDLEVIVVDDGSTDATASAVQGCGDSRVRLQRHPVSQGVSAARNRGIAAATGDWIAFLDDDDLWAPDKLSSQLTTAEEMACGWAYCGTVQVTGSLRVIGGAPPPSPAEVVRWLPWRNMVRDGASNVVVRRSVLAKAGGFDGALRHMSDWDLWIRLSLTGPPAMVPRPLIAYVVHPGNASADTSGILPEFELLNERYMWLRAGEPADRAYVYRWIAWNCLRSGQRWSAVSTYLEAVRMGDIGSLARLAMALLHPDITRNRYGRRRAEPKWRAEAENWLRIYTDFS